MALFHFKQDKRKLMNLTVLLFTVLYPFFVLMYALLGGVFLQIILLVLGLSVFSILYTSSCVRVSLLQKQLLMLVVGTMFIFGAYGAYNTNFKNFGVVLVLLSNIGVAWAVLEYRLTKAIFEYYFYFLLVITLALIFFGYDKNSFNEFLSAGSRNVYSSILIAFAYGYLFSRVFRGISPSIILGVALVYVSFELYSRIGIFLSVFFLFLVFFLKHYSFYLKIFVFSLLAILFVYFEGFWFLERYSNFEKGLSSERFEIWLSYVEHLNFFRFIFGDTFNDIDLIMEFGGNPHSAYIRMHSYFGIGLFILLMCAAASFYYILIKGMFVYLLIFMVFFFRAIFDPIYFIWWVDFLYYPVIFYCFFKSYFLKKRVLPLQSY